MPQMAPMWWTTIMMMTFMMLMLLIVMNYFNLSNNIKTNKNIKMKKFNWMW